MDERRNAPHPIRQRDVEAVINILAFLNGELMIDHLDAAVKARLTRIVGESGLLSTARELAPSAGATWLALGDLVQRLMFVTGRYPREPGPAEARIMHTMRFDREGDLEDCQTVLLENGFTGLRRRQDRAYWALDVVSSELPPNEEFFERERELENIAVQFDGRYEGWQLA